MEKARLKGIALRLDNTKEDMENMENTENTENTSMRYCVATQCS